MVQDSGGAGENLVVSLEVQTKANLQGIEAASRALSNTTAKFVQLRNAAGQFAGTAKLVGAEGEKLANILSQGFSPKFIGSVQAVNQALINAGQTLKTYTAGAVKTGAITAEIANEFSVLSQDLTAVGVTGRASSDSLEEFDQRIAALRPTLQAGVEGTKALGNQIGTLRIQLRQAQEAEGLRKELSSTQKAGQGLLLSFSLTQLAAGRLSQAMFGLGFAVLFTGFKFLNLITVSVALAAALGSVLLDKLTQSFSDGASVTERITEKVTEMREAFAESQGETRLLRVAFAELSDEGINLSETFDRLRKDAEDSDGFFRRVGSAFEFAAKGAVAFGDAAAEAFGFGESGRLGLPAPIELIVPRIDFDESQIRTAIQGLEESVRTDIREFKDALQRESELEAIELSFEIDREGLESSFATVRSTIIQSMDDQTEIIRAELDTQVSARQKSLQNELDGIRDGQRAQTRVIQDALEEQTRAIRESLDERLDIIRDRLDDQLDVIRDGAEKEIDVNKERIDKLKDQERDLENVLSELRSRRAEIISEKIRAEAELAFLESEARRLGVDTTEEQSIIRARIAGLDAQAKATDKEIKARGKTLDSIEDQIEKIGKLIERIEEARDSAIEAARDESKEREKLARETADEEIRQAQRSTENQIDAINKVTRAAQRAAQERSRDDIRELRKTADVAIEENERVHNNIINAKELQLQAELDILGAREKQALQTIKDADFIRDTLIPQLQEAAKLKVPPTSGTVDFILAERRAFQRAFIKFFFPEADKEFFESIGLGFQFGGVVPGPTGKPQLAVVHGGEEVIPPNRRLSSGREALTIMINIKRVDVNQISDLNKLTDTINRTLGRKTNTTIKSRRLSAR